MKSKTNNRCGYKLADQVTPRNFPAVLASLYFNYFDGLTEDTIIRPSRWPAHEQIHLKTFKLALSGLIENTMKQSPGDLFTPGPVFQKGVIVAMLDLYAPCLKKDDASYHFIMEELAGLKNARLASYFEQDQSADFAFVRGALRQAHQRLVAVRNGGPRVPEDAALEIRIEQLRAPLSRSEEGRYYATYALQEALFEFEGPVTAPSDGAQERCRPLVIQYIKALWSLVHEEIIHHHYVFNRFLIYLHAWSAHFEIDNVPAPHPQAVF